MRVMRYGSLVLTAAMASCAIQEPPASHPQITLGVVPADFRTAYGTDGRLDNGTVELPDATLAVTGNTFAIGDLDASFLQAVREAIWLVRLDTGQRVSGEVRDGFFTPAGEAVTTPLNWRGGLGFSFVPSVPLADGWYVFVLESGPLAVGRSLNVSGGYQELGPSDDLTISRFHVGAHPIWSHLYLFCDEVESACEAGLRWSEAVADPSGLRVLVTANDASVSCAQSIAPYGPILTCPFFPGETDFAVTVEGGPPDAEGNVRPSVRVVGGMDGPVRASFGLAAARASR